MINPSDTDAVAAGHDAINELLKFLAWLKLEHGLILCKEYEFGFQPDPDLSSPREVLELVAYFVGLDIGPEAPARGEAVP